MGWRTNMQGIGASDLALVVVSDFLWIGHVGENRALLVREGRARHLVVPHTLGFQKGYRAALREDPDLAMHAEAVTHVLGCGHEHIDVVRAPVSKGERVILGNPGLQLLSEGDWMLDQLGAAELVERFVRESRQKRPELPASILVADLG